MNNSFLKYMVIVSIGLFQFLNYTFTEFALKDILVLESHYWATILTIAFCGIDLGMVAMIFKNGFDDYDWLLIGSWVLASAMNGTFHYWAMLVQTPNHDIYFSVFLSVIFFILRMGIFSMAFSLFKK